jgi:hypothetical protein
VVALGREGGEQRLVNRFPRCETLRHQA